MTQILITVPSTSAPGGVANYYSTLQLDAEPDIEYFAVTGEARGFFSRLARLASVYLRLVPAASRAKTVMVNPSFTRNSFWRDALIVAFARFLSQRVIVFWRGWDWDYFETVSRSPLHRWIFRHSFGAVTETVYLARQFANAATGLGARSDQVVHFETTVADDRYLDEAVDAGDDGEINLLFMSRMDRDKGIYIVIDTYRQLRLRYPNLTLTMAGTGDELEGAKAHVAEHDIGGVDFPGYIRDRDKHRALRRADIFFFPTSYGEGMPNCVLEALAYGLPVVSRNNAGIPDVVRDGEQGFLTDATDVSAFLPLVERLVADTRLRQRMSEAAAADSKRFSRDAVRARMLELLRQS